MSILKWEFCSNEIKNSKEILDDNKDQMMGRWNYVQKKRKMKLKELNKTIDAWMNYLGVHILNTKYNKIDIVDVFFLDIDLDFCFEIIATKLLYKLT
jgi:hypothetical protein